jgi:integrase
MAKSQLSGSFYQRGGRWYWKVRLPGESQIRAFPLTPKGSKFATKDKAVAEVIARDIWTEALRAKAENKNIKCNRIFDLIQFYNQYAAEYYVYKDGTPTSQVALVNISLQYLNDFCGGEEPGFLGPLKLQEFRQSLIDKDLSRSYINTIISTVKRMYKRSASLELISETTYRALTTVDGLREGRSAAKEYEPVKPVEEKLIDRIIPYASRVVGAMMKLHLLTGMRSSELCTMRQCDIDVSDKEVWLYRPSQHKNLWRKKPRIIPIGPKGQETLKPFLSRPLDEYIFNPNEAMIRIADGKIQRKGGKVKHSRYDRNSYRRAIQYAISAYNKANPEKQISSFTPHQSRHTLATEIKRKMGIESASAITGDTIKVVDGVYAERNLELAKEVAKKFG